MEEVKDIPIGEIQGIEVDKPRCLFNEFIDAPIAGEIDEGIVFEFGDPKITNELNQIAGTIAICNNNDSETSRALRTAPLLGCNN